MPAALQIVRTVERPDLVPVVAAWVWDAFWRAGGASLEHVAALFAPSDGAPGPPQTFVLLADGEPVGTASLSAWDLETRPDLTPWLVAVFVAPDARGQGHAARLIAAVEHAARVAAFTTLWLYTLDAERIYRRAGWQRDTLFDHHGRAAVLMRRDLSRPPRLDPITPRAIHRG